MSSDNIPVITIDGPSGSGKGTVSRLLASKLGFHLLDSGALYRVTAMAAYQQGIDLDDVAKVVEVARNLMVNFSVASDEVLVQLNGQDVTRAVRRQAISMGASVIATQHPVRDALLVRQRAFRQMPGLVADGRDMGTTVFPDADLKIFLTASTEQRAQRRYKQLIDKGESVNLSSLLEETKNRDERDMRRCVSPLIADVDAIEMDSTHMSIDQVLSAILALASSRQLNDH
jgi:CMP/dCMP kinase